MTSAPAPIARYLVPEPSTQAELEGLTRVHERLPAGVPHAMALGEGLRLVLVVPTGLAATWRDADPAAVVTESASEQAAYDFLGPPRPPSAPARLVLQGQDGVLASVPLTARRRRFLPDTGSADTGVRIELVVIGWDIRAGSLVGPGDVGSWIEFAWRIAHRAADEFSPPRVSDDVLARQPKEGPATIDDKPPPTEADA
jgi:hypothetical protein